MRKITSLLVLFCMCVGIAWGQQPITDVNQLKNDKVYTIVPKQIERGALYATSTSTVLDACGGTMNGATNKDVTINPSSKDQQFALYKHEDSFYLFSVGANKYVSDVTNNRFPLVEKPGYAVSVVKSDTENYFIVKVKGSEFINVSTGWDCGCVGGWNSTDDGNRLLITEVADMPEDVAKKLNNDFNNQVELTYVYKTGDKEWKRETVEAVKGEAYPAPAAIVGVTFTLPEGNVPAGTVDGAEVVIECVIAGLPFNVSTLTNGEFGDGMKWYNLKMRNKDVTYDAVSSKALTGNVEVKTIYNLFAFTGNPFEGFSIYTYAAGPEKVLWRSDATNGGRVTFTKNTDGNTWVLSKNGDKYVFRLNGHSTGYLNDHQPDLAIWDHTAGATDAGSSFTFEYVDNPDLTGAPELQVLINQVSENVVSGTTVGYPTSESYANVAAALEVARSAVDTKAGCIEAHTALQTAVAAIKTIQPEEGKFYKIVSSCTKDHRAGQDIYVNNDGSMHFAKSDENGLTLSSQMGRVWQFVPATDGKFYIKNVERGVFMQSVGTASETDDTKAKAVTIKNMGKSNVVSINPDGQNQMHAQDANSKVVAWNNNDPDNGSAWIIEEVSMEDLAHTVTVGEAGYSTLILGYNAEIPAGVEAYAVSDATDGFATLTQVSGVLPAAEAVVLKNQGTYEFKFTTAEATTIESNLLKGSTIKTNISESAFVLSKVDNEVGFYLATLNVSTDKTNDGTTEEPAVTYEAWLNNAFKAYLPMTATQGANMLRFNFGGETTAIDAVEVENANAPIYDLSGRRVLSTVKGGIYIQNGKKFIVK